LEHDRANETIGRKYNIAYVSVAGCEVTTELLDSIHKENEKTSKALIEKFGTSWSQTFRNEVKQMLVTQKKIDALLQQNKIVAAKQKQIAKKDEVSLIYTINLTERKNIFKVAITYYAKENEVFTLKHFKTAFVNLQTKHIQFEL
jgi:uncharacterized transporter YbjL